MKCESELHELHIIEHDLKVEKTEYLFKSEYELGELHKK